jgi:hypothetical protein
MPTAMLNNESHMVDPPRLRYRSRAGSLARRTHKRGVRSQRSAKLCLKIRFGKM